MIYLSNLLIQTILPFLFRNINQEKKDNVSESFRIVRILLNDNRLGTAQIF